MTGLIDYGKLDSLSFDWGGVKWYVTPDANGAGLTMGMVVILPDKGHARHCHEGADEIIYILSGEGVQTVNDSEPFAIKAGDTLYLPDGAPHSTYNTGWDTLRALVFYAPGGADRAFKELPDCRELDIGKALDFVRNSG